MMIQETAGTAASPARPNSLTEQIYERMHEEILSAALTPGDLVLEADLAKRYGVSKTPVREALRQLADRGWILTIPRRGYLVKPLRLHDIKEVFELRLLLEPGLFAHAARGGDAAHFARLRELVGRTAEEAMPDDSQSSPGREFHLAAARMADNQRATAILTSLLDEVRRLHHVMPEVRTHPETSDVAEDHRAILEAMEARDADAVHKLVRDHIQDSADRVLRAFQLAIG
ncbi:GntR family transcriptional regulator [Microbacterium sp. 2FI]|uniref:GntR family transcriptional regulator n=1 Tax=Microbacterium sp. 2FI TaxID=2502193 RepID=UPI0010F5E113|nr:GntR family transcriptional regulator [Microbacterium sp. 2FI]